MHKTISYMTKVGSIASTTVMGATLLASNAPFLSNSLEIGGALGLGLGGLVAHAIGELEKKRQVLPILGIGIVLANGGYIQGAKWWHSQQLAYELQKSEYSYLENTRNLNSLHYDDKKYTAAKNEYLLSINSENKERETKLKEIDSFIVDKENYIQSKTSYLLKQKYDNRGHRTARYNSLISPYLELASNYGIILPPSGKKGTMEDYKAVQAIAEVIYSHELNKLKSSIPKKEEIAYPVNVEELSFQHISKIRTDIQSSIAKDIEKANNNIDSLQSLEEKAWIVGVFTEIILAPILLWIQLLKEVPNPFRQKTGVSIRERKEIIEHSIDIKKEDIAQEVKDIKEVLKNKGFRITKKLEQILHVSLDVFANDLNKMVVIKAKKEGETRLIVFDSYQDRISYQNGDRSVAHKVVNKREFVSRGGNLSLFPDGDSFKVPFNETIKFMKWLTLNIELSERVAFESLQNVIVKSYGEYK